MVVIVCGIIGAGKSTFSHELSRCLGRDCLYLKEPDERDNLNPYLSDFYQDPERWAFTMQTSLLSQRYAQHLQAQWYSLNTGHWSVLDSSYYQDTSYARLLVKTGKMSNREWDTYRTLYRSMTASVLLPSACIRLDVDPEVASDRIRRRFEQRTGRSCESVISLDYLRALNEEIKEMVAILSQQGVHVIELPWSMDQGSEETRRSDIEGVARLLSERHIPDIFLELHRRVTLP